MSFDEVEAVVVREVAVDHHHHLLLLHHHHPLPAAVIAAGVVEGALAKAANGENEVEGAARAHGRLELRCQLSRFLSRYSFLRLPAGG